MVDLAGERLKRGASKPKLVAAVHRHKRASREGFSERLFTWLFSGLVYPQIWEDPEIDIEAMALKPGHRLVAIASGGCNLLSYIAAAPVAIDAVDLNAHHVALNRLKLAAAKHLPAHGDFLRFFGSGGHHANPAAFEKFLSPQLDGATRAYWSGRDWRGRQRISVFTRDFYRTGLLGRFISAAHLFARANGVDPSELAKARTLAEQRAFFHENLAPLFNGKLLRAITGRKSSLFGLGIPPAQFDALASEGDTMADVLKARLEKLACHFPLADNPFAWQAFARRYPTAEEGRLPVYLQAANFAAIRANAHGVTIHHANFTDLLAKKPAGTIDRFVLLDAQDWMTDDQLNALWSEIDRTAAPGARVIFRTAARPSLLPGRVSGDILGHWRYDAAASADYCARDRSAIYGGFHLYEKIAA